ncbi:hypothetical protein, partial [Mycobacterium sp.]|uniref:hypothetical protein n=1 Tax=Mycobacterium sp. TaxID=1785 RepID=UPI003F96AC2E
MTKTTVAGHRRRQICPRQHRRWALHRQVPTKLDDPAHQVPAEIIAVRALAHHESFAHERFPELGGVNEQTVAGVALSCDQNGHAP